MICGIDIGGTKIETCIFDPNYINVAKWRVATPVDDYEKFITTIVEQITKAQLEFAASGPIGIGLPGITDKNGLSLTANIPCCNGRNVKFDISSLVSDLVVIENDCRCFTLSEAIGGAAHGYRRVFGAILGTGAAGGLCIDKILYKGANNAVGEYGHIPIPSFLQEKYSLFSIICACGLESCMENYVSGPGLKRLINHYTQTNVSTHSFFAGLSVGNEQFEDIFNVYKDLLGYTFASIVNNYDPDVIVLGGGMSNVDIVSDSIRNSMLPYILSSIEPPPILRAKFGDASGVRGAAILAGYRQFQLLEEA